MREGGVRQIIFPPELGYPMVGDQRDGKMADPSHDRVGPKPTSFSGSRALDFVLTSKSDNVDDVVVELQGCGAMRVGGKPRKSHNFHTA